MSAEVESVDQLVGAAACRGAEAGEAADQLQVLAAGEEVVEAGVLAGDADPASDAVSIGDDVEAVDEDTAGRRVGAGSSALG